MSAVVLLGGAALIAANWLDPPSRDARALLFILIGALTGLVKVPLPVGGSISLAYAFVLATLMGFGLGASTLAGVLSTLSSAVASRWRGSRPPLHQTAFNAGLVALSCLGGGLGYVALGGSFGAVELPAGLVPVLAYTAIFLVVNLGLVSVVIHVSVQETIGPTLGVLLRWAVPGYVAGSSLAVLLNMLFAEGQPSLLLLAAPFFYLVHLAYRTRTERVDELRRHSEQTAELYKGVTGALALAIEAKDEKTEEHLHRVQHYCLGIGKILGLPEAELEALRAAALLHDIGKIAVPEYVLTKPGRLTPQEQKLIRQHPVVGAEILGAVPFPYPLAPIVRHHHERWDGAGYPDGLAAQAIPLGARILAVVDCYDALISDRPYRKAVSRDEACAFLQREAGRMFDPSIVELLLRNALDLELRLSSNAKLRHGVGRRGSAAAEGQVDAHGRDRPPMPELDLLTRIEIPPGQSSPQRILELVAAKIGTVIPYRTLIVYRLDDDRSRLTVAFATGTAARQLRGLVIPVGERLAGWAVLHQRSYRGTAHENPLERDGSRNDFEGLLEDPEVAELRSALVAPLTTARRRLGVLGLYHDRSVRYSERDLELVAGSAERLARLLESVDLPGGAASRASLP